MRAHTVPPASSGPSTVDAAEVAKFGAMAATWWDPLGPFRPLHAMNPTRMAFIAAAAQQHFATPESAPLSGLSVLDVGSGGGLLCESLARLGPNSVLGVDVAAANVAMARAHAAGDPTLRALKYRHATAEALVAAGRQFDVVTSVEVIEHVSDPAVFAAVCAQLVRPGGLLILSTMNRTAKAYAMAILGAEHVLRWVPPGTHEWHKFLTPFEMQQLVTGAHTVPLPGVLPEADAARGEAARRRGDADGLVASGMVFRPPPLNDWVLDAEDFGSNYIAAFPIK